MHYELRRTWASFIYDCLGWLCRIFGNMHWNSLALLDCLLFLQNCSFSNIGNTYPLKQNMQYLNLKY